MKITCQSCQSKYTVSDEKVQGKTVKIKCRKCGATILVNSSGVTTSGGGTAESVSTDASPAAGSYLVNVGEGDQRSMTVAEIVSAYQSSVVTSETYIWADGMADWQPLSQVDAIISALSSSGPSAPVAAASAPQAARREPERRADIFARGRGVRARARRELDALLAERAHRKDRGRVGRVRGVVGACQTRDA